MLITRLMLYKVIKKKKVPRSIIGRRKVLKVIQKLISKINEPKVPQSILELLDQSFGSAIIKTSLIA